MRHRRWPIGIVLAASIALLAVAPASGQEDEEQADAPVFAVTGVEYAFTGLPTSVPAGVALGMVQELTVTAPGTEPGPLPVSAEEPVAQESADAEGESPEAAGESPDVVPADDDEDDSDDAGSEAPKY